MMNKIITIFVIFTSFSPLALAEKSDLKTINALLDDFHQAAAVGDKQRYLNHFAPNSVFMGTDDWERWPLAEFIDYVDKRFVDGKGWNYHSEERNVSFSTDGNTGWFDEIMVSEQWGRFRGTGVVVHIDNEWKIAFYSLTLLLPNEAWEKATQIATEAFEARK